MKTGLSTYNQEMVCQPFKRPHREPQAFDLPSELWNNIIFENLMSNEEHEMLSHLANMQSVCRKWNKLCWNVKVELCQKIGFEALFQLPCHKDVRKINSTVLENLLDLEQTLEDAFEAHEFVSDLTHPCLRFLQTYGSRVQSVKFRHFFNYLNLNIVLKAMPNLQQLVVEWPSDDMCYAISQATNLKSLELDLIGCAANGKGLKALSTLPLLEKLIVTSDLSDGESGEFISGFNTLEYLEIHDNGSGDIFKITALQNLTHLDYESSVCIGPVNFISHLTNLTFLNFSCRNEILATYQDITSILQLPALTEANLALSFNFNEQELSQLTSFKNLYYLTGGNFQYHRQKNSA